MYLLMYIRRGKISKLSKLSDKRVKPVCIRKTFVCICARDSLVILRQGNVRGKVHGGDKKSVKVCRCNP